MIKRGILLVVNLIFLILNFNLINAETTIMIPTVAADYWGNNQISPNGGTVDVSDDTLAWPDPREDYYIQITAWNDSIPSGNIITNVTLYCEVDWIDDKGEQVAFGYNTGSGWTDYACMQSAVEMTIFSCNLYNLGIDSVTEVNNLDTRCEVYDDQSPLGGVSIDYTYLKVDHISDTTPPNLTIVYPTNTTYNVNVAELNYTVDITAQSCWYSLDNGITNTTIACGTNVTGLTSDEGSNTWRIYANDSVGNLNSTSITFFVDSLIPLVSIDQPENITYSITDLQINYTATDDNLQACWWSDDNSITNNSIICGQNTSYTASQGSTILRIYANDSVGNLNSTSITFFVDSLIPLVEFGDGTEQDAGNFSRNWVYVNVTVEEGNFVNITFYLYNSSGLVNETSYENKSFEINFTGLADRLYFYNVTVYDAAGNSNSTETRTIRLDTAPPTITISQPTPDQYGYNESLPLNFSVFDSGIGIDSCWYNLDGEENISLPNCQNTTFNISEGSHTLYIYANDSLNNVGSKNITFVISIGPPSIILGGASGWINYKNNVYLNYTLDDVDNVVRCDLWLDNGIWHLNQTNSSSIIKDQTNYFLLNLTDGNYKWNVNCTDEQGNSAFALFNKTLKIDTILPELNLNSPLNNTVFKQNISIILNFSIQDLNLQTCWYTLNNGIINLTIPSCINGSNNIIFSYPNGTYNLSVYANDSASNLGFVISYNITIEHDNIPPNLTIMEPIGTKYSQNNIPLEFLVSDNVALSSCWYNLSWWDGESWSIYRTDTSINCSLTTTTFSVADNYLYLLLLSVNDTTNNINTSNSTFTISTQTSQPPSNTGSGGGGGGGSILRKNKTEESNESVAISNIEIFDLEEMIIHPGESKTLGITVKNSGKKFLNNCKLQTKKEFREWITSKQIRGLAIGETADFIFTINIPYSAETANYKIPILLICNEDNASTEFKISVVEKYLEINIKDIEQKGKNLNIDYSLNELAGFTQNVSVEYWLSDEFNNKLAVRRDIIELNANEDIERTAVLDISYIIAGKYSLTILAVSDLGSSSAYEELLIGKPKVGFAIFEGTTGNIALAIIITCLMIFLAVIIIRKIIKNHRKLTKQTGRGIVKINLK